MGLGIPNPVKGIPNPFKNPFKSGSTGAKIYNATSSFLPGASVVQPITGAYNAINAKLGGNAQNRGYLEPVSPFPQFPIFDDSKKQLNVGGIGTTAADAARMAALNEAQQYAQGNYEIDKNERDALFEIALRKLQKSKGLGGADAANLQAEIEAALKRLDLNEEDLGNQRGTLDRQIPLIDKLFSYREGTRNAAEEYQRALDDLSAGDFTRTNKYLDDLLGFAGEERGLADSIARTGAERATRESYDAAAATSGTRTVGLNEGLGDIKTALSQQLQGTDLTYRQKTTDIGKQRGDVESGYAKQKAESKKFFSDSYFQRKIDEATTAEDKAKIQDAYKQLDIRARELGISREEYQRKLAAGMARIGIQNSMNEDDIFALITSKNAQDARAKIALQRELEAAAGL